MQALRKWHKVSHGQLSQAESRTLANCQLVGNTECNKRGKNVQVLKQKDDLIQRKTNHDASMYTK